MDLPSSGVPFEDAAQGFCGGLRRYVRSLGKADRYHETITWAFLALVNERQAARPFERFEDFAAANPDRLEPRPLSAAPLL